MAQTALLMRDSRPIGMNGATGGRPEGRRAPPSASMPSIRARIEVSLVTSTAAMDVRPSLSQAMKVDESTWASVKSDRVCGVVYSKYTDLDAASSPT